MATKLPKSPVVLAASITIATLLPIWRSGGRRHLNFWQFILNHTIWGPPVEYIPEENYGRSITRRG